MPNTIPFLRALHGRGIHVPGIGLVVREEYPTMAAPTQAKRQRPEGSKSMYYSDLRERTTVTLAHVMPSIQREGETIAVLKVDGRDRYLKFDSEDDARLLAGLDPQTELELQNVGNQVSPGLAVWLDGHRIDARAKLAGAITGAGLPGADEELGGRGARQVAARPTLDTGALKAMYAEAVTAALELREQLEDAMPEGFDVQSCAGHLFRAALERGER
jgi:hypothetical protein